MAILCELMGSFGCVKIKVTELIALLMGTATISTFFGSLCQLILLFDIFIIFFFALKYKK